MGGHAYDYMYCRKCRYRGLVGGYYMCLYWEKPGNGLRPCPPGKDCIFSPQNGGAEVEKRQKWNVDELHELYISGMPPKEICEKTGVPRPTLGGYVNRLGWCEEREKLHPGILIGFKNQCKPKWDIELGKELYFARYKLSDITEICNVGYNALCYYIQNHDWNQERKNQMEDLRQGVKDKNGKAPLGMTFALRKAVNAIAFIREYGLTKYPNADNWKSVPMQDWADAAERHMTAWQSGEVVDPESGMPHLWHVLTNIAYMVELEGK